MPEINLTDSRKRDAKVNAESVTISHEYRWIDEDQLQAGSRKILRSTVAQDLETLEKSAGSLEKIGQVLVDGDPEVDIENFGRFLNETSRAYVNPEGEIVHHLSRWQVIYTPDGQEKVRRPMVMEEPNVASEIPLRWTGKPMKKADACRRFVFSKKMQLQHTNGLTYDFLYSMAKDLHDQDSLMLLGAGEKGNKPLVFRRGGLNYRGFLEGRIDGSRYALILHLSNMELRQPGPGEKAAE